MSDHQAQQNESTDFGSTPVQGWLKWIEILGITLLFLVVGAWNRPEDPFYLTGSFAWPLLAPLLAGLRYGFFGALVSALLLLGVVGMVHRQGLIPVETFPYVWGIGILACSLLAGEFRDYWGRRLEKLEASNRYRAERLEDFTRNFYLLKVSHDRLEQQLAGSSGSLREALRRLYQELSHTREKGLSAENGELMLQLLIRYGQLQIAAIYPVIDGELSDSPVARVGAFRDVRKQDPLLLHALQEKKLVSVQTEYRAKLADLDTDLLLALPLIDSRQVLLGLVVVEAMPFFNFHPRTLRLMAILAGHMADMVQEQTEVSETGSAEWRQFVFQLNRACDDARKHSLPASLVRLTFTNEVDAERVAERMRQLRRGLDVVTELPSFAGTGLAILLPLTDELGLESYLQRLSDDLREKTGQALSEQAVVDTRMVSGESNDIVWLTGGAEGGAS